ncbi:MAG: restriction endonuclease [Zymomonas mobilis]|uniref:Restriction system protein n=1 Tax=Zymomonas mobilis TaxID=542 RepID=A0A542VZ33_ZYMMB|nr:restriction endonuclease [Zymomonas mobilis]TQL16582.1 restriction system protein [Zymomonas mobilis]
MAVPSFSQLMLPVLRFAATGQKRMAEAEIAIADELGLSATDRDEMLPSGRERLLHNRISWAKTYLTKAGLLNIPTRGQFTISKSGKQLLRTKPSEITVTTLKNYPPFIDYCNRNYSQDTQETSVPTTTQDHVTGTPEERMEAAHKELQTELRSEILHQIAEKNPTFFEQLIVDLMVAMGYGGNHEDAARRIGGTGDGGVDGVINEDRLGIDRIYVQAKRYAPHVSVGRPEIQAFVGSLVGHRATKGVFVTTSSFSMPALEYVEHLPQRVILINGEMLADLMIEHNVGVRTSRTIEIKRVDQDFFNLE